MVVFTCNHCGDSLQKPRVEKHYNFQCKKAKSLTCVDCLKDFREEEYVSHNKCVTEEERYAAKGSIPNGIVKKGEIKQESWMEMIKSIAETETNIQPSVKKLLNTISTYTNVPRKKQKFFNFVKSSSGGHINPKDMEAVWGLIEKYKIDHQNAQAPKSESDTIATNNENEASEKKTDKNKKRKSNDVEDSEKQKKKLKSLEIKDEITVSNGSDVNLEKNKKKKRKLSISNENNVDESKENGNDDVVLKKAKKSKKKDNTEIIKENSEIVTKESENAKSAENAINNGVSKKSKKKNKSAENGELKQASNIAKSSDLNESEDVSDGFCYEEVISEILKDAGSLSLKKLHKKVLKAFRDKMGEVKTDAKIIKKVNKKMKKIKNVKIDNDNVSFVSS